MKFSINRLNSTFDVINDIKDTFNQYAPASAQVTELLNPDVASVVLSKDTVFATLAGAFVVNGPLKYREERSFDGKTRKRWWEGIDENSLTVGYLSHNNHNLRFQTKDSFVFDEPFSQLQIEAHGVGLIIKTASRQYALSNFQRLSDQFSPSEKMDYRIGGETVIWMRELANIGAIDKIAYDKSVSDTKKS